MIEATAWQAAESLFLDQVDRSKVLPWSRRAAMRRPDSILAGPVDGTESQSVPYAYRLGPQQLEQREHPAYDPRLRDAFFLDEACQELICRTYDTPAADTELQRYVVVDHAAQPIGTIERIPRRNAFSRHGWRLVQPGRPELLAEDPPLAQRLLRAAPGRALELAIVGPVDALLGSGGSSDSDGPGPRELEWWTRPAAEPAPERGMTWPLRVRRRTGTDGGDAVTPDAGGADQRKDREKALTMLRRVREDRPHPWRVWVPWLDRRLVIAQMLIPDR